MMRNKNTTIKLVLDPEPAAEDLAILNPREQRALAMQKSFSLVAISRELHMSKERVRQIQNRAIEEFAKRISGTEGDHGPRLGRRMRRGRCR